MIEINEFLDKDVNKASTLNTIRDAVIYSFFTTGPPPRSQNMMLLNHNEDNITVLQAQAMVDEHNKKCERKNKVTGVFITLPSDEGYFNIIWTAYKTVKAFGVQKRTVCHPFEENSRIC